MGKGLRVVDVTGEPVCKKCIYMTWIPSTQTQIDRHEYIPQLQPATFGVHLSPVKPTVKKILQSKVVHEAWDGISLLKLS